MKPFLKRMLRKRWNPDTGHSAVWLSVEPLEQRAMLTGTVVPGLVASWNFDEGPDWQDDAFQATSTAQVAFDSVGVNHASLTNMDPASWVSGQQFTGLLFDGVDDFLSVPHDLGATLGGTVSVAFWIKTTQSGGASPMTAPAVLGNDFIQFGSLDSAGRLGLAVNNQWLVRTPAPVNDDAWHFVVFTQDASTGLVQVFLDGQNPVSSNSGQVPPLTSITSIGLHDSGLSADRYFAGRLDQLSLFNDDLDLAAVRELMHNYAPKTWETTTAGMFGQSFSTTSVFYHAFDAEHDPLRVVSFSQPAHGTVEDQGDGTFLYHSQSGYVGADHFDVVIEDGHGGFSRTTMNLDVRPAAASSIDQFTTNFTNFSEITAGGSSLDYSTPWRVPRTVDWDGDGKHDLLVSADDAIWLYHNIGTPQAPEFAAGVKVQAAGQDISTGSTVISMTLADLTGDGVDDLIISDEYRLRLYENTSNPGQVPVYAAPVYLKAQGGSDLSIENPRFDVGDWNNDGLLDLIVGTYQSYIYVYPNVGTAAEPQFSPTPTPIGSEAYNFYPRWIDLSRDGIPDLVRGINWGDVLYWLDPTSYGSNLEVAPYSYLSITAQDGSTPALHGLTDGPVVDFADFNGDGVFDVVIGGQLAGSHVFIAYGQQKTMADYLADLEAIYDAHPDDLGTALVANNQQLLTAVNQANQGIINLLQAASPADRETMYDEFAAHIQRYSFLRLKTLDTTVYHYIPSLVVQDILIAGELRTATPTNRAGVADLFEMTGLHRQIYIEFGYVVGDNVQASDGQLQSILTFLRNHPRESYSDKRLSVGSFWGDGNGANIENFGQGKNTFADDTGWAVDEWADDLRDAILAVKPGNPTAGDIFTFVLGHEATHALDAYIRSRANTDLARRWGQYLVLAGGPDIVAGENGFMDGAATQQHFLSAGLWDGQPETWDQAWEDYWSTGPGASIGGVNNLRGNIKFLLENPQESLATQGNQHWVDSEGRIIGAIDRFQRGITPVLTEAITFLDFLSVGMNRVPMFDITANSESHTADWTITYADLERDDLGHITRLTMTDGREYTFTVNALGVYTAVTGPTSTQTSLGPVIVMETVPSTIGRQETVIDSSATVSDGDSPLNFLGSVLTVSGQTKKDTLSILAGQGIQLAGRGRKNVTYFDTVIGTVAGGRKSLPLTVNLLSSASPQAVQTLLRSITFKSRQLGHRTIKFQITNIGGADTNEATRQLNVTR